MKSKIKSAWLDLNLLGSGICSAIIAIQIVFIDSVWSYIAASILAIIAAWCFYGIVLHYLKWQKIQSVFTSDAAKSAFQVLKEKGFDDLQAESVVFSVCISESEEDAVAMLNAIASGDTEAFIQMMSNSISKNTHIIRNYSVNE